MYIPVNGETSLYCDHSAGREGWYRGSTLISIENGMNSVPCDCLSTVEGPGIRLTFSNFNGAEDQPTRAGEDYGCWANTLNGFEKCFFTVAVVGELPVCGADTLFIPLVQNSLLLSTLE